MSVENLNKAVETQSEGREQITSTQDGSRRLALNAVLIGGMTSFLAACGKYVARFDKPLESQIGKRSGDGAGKTGGSGDATGATNSGNTDPGLNPTPTAKPPVGDPTDPNYDPRPCIDVTIAPEVMPGTVLKVAKPAMYGSSQSAILAMKFKESELSVGNHVYVFALRPADEKQGVLLATRRVQSSDVYAGDGVGVVFESLSFKGFKKLAVILVRGGVSTRFTIDVTAPFRKSVPDGAAMLQVFDLADARVAGDNAKLFGLEYHLNAPRVPSSAINVSSANLGNTSGGTAFLAAKSNSEWDTSALTAPSGATGVRIEDIFGEQITPSNTMFHKHQSVVVYVKKKKNIGGMDVEGYLRYFFFIG